MICSVADCPKENHAKYPTRCWTHRAKKWAPVAEPVAEPIAEPIAESVDQKKDDVELIDDVEKKVIETDIVPPTPMSPNTSSIITESSEPAIVEAEKSPLVENNSTPGSYIPNEIFDFQDADKTHSVVDDIYMYKAFLRFVEEDGLPVGYFNYGEMSALREAGKSCVQYVFFECSQEVFDEAQAIGKRPKNRGVVSIVFDSDADRDLAIDAFEKMSMTAVEIVLRSKDYDEHLYDLCRLISPHWFKDRDNMWNFTRMVYQMPGDPSLYRRTYAVILADKFGEHFSELLSMTQYDTDGPVDKYPVKVSISKLKAIAGGSNPEGYKAWKAKYEPEPIKEEKVKKDKAVASVSDDDEKRNDKLLGLIAKEVSMTAEQLKTAIYDDSVEFSFEWCELYVKPMNRPIIEDFRKWGKLVKYIHCYEFPNDVVAAKMLALIVDLYFVCMVNGERYRRVDLTKDDSNAEMVKENVDPFKMMLFHIATREKPINASALMVQQQPYFHAYESFIVSFEKLMSSDDSSVFNSCIPFKAQIVDDVDYSLCADILTFLYEIICDNDSRLYVQLMTALAKMVQFPDSKTEMLIILYSALEGCGKTCFTDLLLAIFGIHSVDVSAGSIESLVNERRSHLIGKKLCIVNEVREMKSSFGQHHEAFKSFLTDKYLSARPLYANKITFRNVLEAVITTNNLATIPSGKGARRFQLFRLNDSRCQDKSYFGNLYMNSISKSEVIDAFYTYLMQEIKVERGPMDQIIQTEAQAEFRQATEDNVSSFWRYIYNDVPGVSLYAKMEAYNSYNDWCQKHGEVPLRMQLFGTQTMGIKYIKDDRSSSRRVWRILRDTADAPIVASAPSKPTSPLHTLRIERSKSGAMQLL